MRRLTMLALFLVCAGLLAGCAARVPSEPPAIRGVVTSISTGQDGLVTIRVVAHPNAGAQLDLDAADVTVSSATKVLTSPNSTGERAARSDASAIAVRDYVEVWITGPVRESYPVQADAKVVLVYGRLKADVPLPFPRGLEPEPAP